MKKKTTIIAFCTVLILAISVCALAGPVPDTGQTKCYDDLGNEITCPQPGKPFYGQDANYTINPPSYTKLDAQGNDLPDTAASWVMVRDNVTGLIWEVKTDDGSVHDKDNTYTWYDRNPETNGGDTGTPGDGTDTEDFINALNSANFGGYSDWRMPDPEELRSIVDYGRIWSALDTDYFPNIVSSSSHYWSSTTYAYYLDNAWHVSFYDGGINRYDKSYSDYVRAVRGGQSWSFDNLVINGDGTVTDTSTGLMWQQKTAGTMTWEAALSYCENLSLGGYSDWRLPTIKELASIADLSKYKPAIDTTAFLDTMSSHYWSSTTRTYNTGYAVAWQVYFGSGGGSGANKSSNLYVRAVLSGQCWSLGHLVISAPAQALSWDGGL